MLLLFAIKYQVFVISDQWTSYNVEILKHEGAACRAGIRKTCHYKIFSSTMTQKRLKRLLCLIHM